MTLDYAKTPGGIIKAAREAANLTLRELARQVGTSAAFICDIEHNRRLAAADTLDAICDVAAVDRLKLRFAYLKHSAQGFDCVCQRCGRGHSRLFP